MIQSVDIVIVGGGMVGLTLAAALKQSHLRIAVVEQYELKEELHSQVDLRVSALNHASEQILRNLDAWQGIEQRRLTAYNAIKVWEQDSFAHIEFDASSLIQSYLGHIVENRVVQLALIEQVKQQSNVTLYRGEQCQSLVVGEREAWLTLMSGRVLTAKLIVGADGANSWVREQQNIPLIQWDYGHTAIVANIRTEEPHQYTARQTMTPRGILALLPQTESYMSSMVWSTTPEHAERLTNMSNDDFNKQLTTEFDARLGRCELVGATDTFPLKMRYAKDFVLERIALVGDAAHTIHPLAGQGINLGLLDAASLAEEILAKDEKGGDIGSKKQLRYYERWRKAEATKMILAMQGFRDLFEGGNPAKKFIRGLGMNLVGELSPLKNVIMKRALGFSGDLPQLAQKQTSNKGR